MPCCRCHKGICSTCVCARLRRPCVNCETSSCSNVAISQCDANPQPAITVKFAITKKSSGTPLQSISYHQNGRSSTAPTDSSSGKECVVPRHWTLYNGCIESSIRNMHIYHKPCLVSVCDSHLWHLAGRLVKKTWFDESKWQIDVINVHQVENPVLYQRYMSRRKEIRLSTGCALNHIRPVNSLAGQKDILTNTLGLQLGELEKDINECVLLHGTTADAVSAIAQNGIDLRLANPSGRYGSGIYLAESSVKSNMYTDYPRGVTHKLYAFIVRASLGKPFVSNVPHTFRRPPCAEPGCCSLDSCIAHRRFYDSVIGTSVVEQHTHREFIIYDPAQCLPELVVTYSLWPSNGLYQFK